MADARENHLFDFGIGPAAPGFAKVTPETVYTKARGYGLDLG